jgi:hypothetical protein
MKHKRQDQRRLVEAIYTDVCDQFAEAMVLYAVATLRGEALPENFEQFQQHMRACKACTENYHDLLATLKAEATEVAMDGIEMPVIPPPWAARQKAPKADEREIDYSGFRVWLTQHGDALVRLMVELSNLGRLTPQIEMRSQDPHRSDETPLGEFVFDTAGIKNVQDVELRVAVTTDTANSAQRELRIEISMSERWPDFSGAVVSLHQATGEVKSQVTGRNGIVKFADLTLEEIRRARVEVSLPTA